MLKLKKGIRSNIGFIIAVVSIIVVIGAIWIAISSLEPPDLDEIEAYLERDKADFAIITEYFIGSGYSYINIDKSDFKKGVMFTGANTGDKEIEDEAVTKALKRLFEKREYRVIGRNDNTVFFQKWAFLEKECGIAYSINGEDKPVVEFLVKLEVLSEDGWFYYEADYEEFRNR